MRQQLSQVVRMPVHRLDLCWGQIPCMVSCVSGVGSQGAGIGGTELQTWLDCEDDSVNLYGAPVVCPALGAVLEIQKA